MAIPYRKEIIKPDGRKLTTGGPRDQQRRIREGKDQETLIDALKVEIEALRDNMVVGKGAFTGEQVDEEIRQAVIEAIEIEKKNSDKEINKLKNSLEEKTNKVHELSGELGVLNEKVTSLAATIVERDESLDRERERNKTLLQQMTTTGDDLIIETNRPRMEPTFIDPLEKDAGDRLVPHIQVDDIKSDEKADMQSKVKKLKGLIGQLPNRN